MALVLTIARYDPLSGPFSNKSQIGALISLCTNDKIDLKESDLEPAIGFVADGPGPYYRSVCSYHVFPVTQH